MAALAATAICLGAEPGREGEPDTPSGRYTYARKESYTLVFDGQVVKQPDDKRNPGPFKWEFKKLEELEKELESKRQSNIKILEYIIDAPGIDAAAKTDLAKLKAMDWRAFGRRFSTKKEQRFVAVHRQYPGGDPFFDLYLYEDDYLIAVSEGGAYIPEPK